MCFGPNQGQNVTFVRPSQWIGEWRPIEPQQALTEMARRYLNAYGPAATDDFARWWGTPSSQAKKVFRLLGGEIEAVDVEGWKAWALTSTLGQLKTLKAVHSMRLLPQFDAYTVGVSRDCEPILSKKYKSRVYRPQGWISAVVLIDGRMEGIWEADFGSLHTRWGRWVAPLLRRFERISDNLDGLLPALFREAGLENVEEVARFATLFGTLSILYGRKPD